MLKLLKKELLLTASPLSYIFIAFALIAILPGYPILVGSFFACLGIFQTFQAAREANDITYTALLPIAKGDVVKAKYAFCVCIQACYFVLTAAVTLVRMTVLAETPVFQNNALMPANLVYLGFVLLIFGCFNAVFVRGFFKTAYKFGKPFVSFIVVAFVVVGVAETLFHLPPLAALGARGFEHLAVQSACLVGGAVVFALLTVLFARAAIRTFEKVDL